jgi:pimeloyl-ACP methyl ester carboxylesterase
MDQTGRTPVPTGLAGRGKPTASVHLVAADHLAAGVRPAAHEHGTAHGHLVAADRGAAPFPPVPGVDVEHTFVDLDGVRIHVALAGAGEPLVLYHGWPQHWWMWRGVIPELARHYRIIAPDIRGFGWSDAPAGSYLKDDLADEFVRLLRALGLSRVRLLSHDWGGWIGFIASARHPELIAQHFATNIPPIWPRVNAAMFRAMLRFGYMFRISMPALGPRMLQRDPSFVHHLLTRGGTHPRGWAETELRAFSERLQDPARARASARLYGDFLLREFVPLAFFGRYHRYRIATPTRLLFGERDFALALSWLDGHQGRFDDFALELVPDCGHFIVDERPELVAERALSFFSHSAADAGKS